MDRGYFVAADIDNAQGGRGADQGNPGRAVYEKDSGILESYRATVRKDDVAKHAGVKQRFDQLAENNTAIVALIKTYAPLAKASAFTVEADKLRNYASAWRDRWNSVLELLRIPGHRGRHLSVIADDRGSTRMTNFAVPQLSTTTLNR